MAEIPTSDCRCPACSALAERYRNDPALLAFYRKKLLVKGWAGRTDPIEKAYILAHAPWAQHAAEVGSRNLAQVSKAHDQMPSAGEVVSEDLRGGPR